jgi:hypothetical protein
MNPHADHQLDELLRRAARDERPAAWAASATRGLEARVLQRISRPPSWGDALFSLSSWRPLAAAATLAAATGFWSAPALAEIMDDEWIASQAAEEEADADAALTPDIADPDVGF